jgi:hypothetical protein
MKTGNKLFGFRLYEGQHSDLLIEQTENFRYNSYLFHHDTMVWQPLYKNETLEDASYLVLNSDIVILATF